MGTHILIVGLLFGLLQAVQGVIINPGPPANSSQISNILFPSPTEYLLLLWDKTTWKSVDEGQTWTFIMGNIIEIWQTPNDLQSIIFLSGDLDTFYLSSDGGSTIAKGTFPVIPFMSPYGVFIHPNNGGWIMIFPSPNYVKGVYTKDGGNTWFNMTSMIYSINYATWSANPDTPDTFFALVPTSQAQDAFQYTTNYGANWTTIFENVVGFQETQHFMFVGVFSNHGGMNLFASNTFRDATHMDPNQYYICEFPFGDLFGIEHAYTFVDDSLNTEFIGVYTGVPTQGSIFSSDFSGLSYSFALDHVSMANYVYDFSPVPSLQGVYLANKYLNATSNILQTFISFDVGANWRSVMPPTADRNGNPFSCSYPACSLQLHGITSWLKNIPPYYSVPSAIGLMVALGNVGTAVSFNRQNLTTFLTRDGGLTWIELWHEATIYDVGDHGGLIVFASILYPTNTIYFTSDEGNTVSSFQFFDNSTKVYVQNIMTDPSGLSRKFLVIGRFTNNTKFLLGLDFSDDFNVPCDDSDYELWEPSDGSDHGDLTCFLGATTVYSRRKYLDNCYSNISDHVVSVTPCPCAFEDYECDWDFWPSARNATDGFTCSNTTLVPSCATGYRLIPGTLCQSGLDLISYNCSGYSASAVTGEFTTATIATISTTGPRAPTTTSGTSSTIFVPSTTSTTSDQFTSTTSSTGPRPTSGGSTYTSTTTSTSGNPHQSITTGEPGSSTGRPKSHTGEAVGLTFLFVFVAAGGVVGFLYFRNSRFRFWLRAKLRLDTDSYEPLSSASYPINNNLL